VIATPWLSSVKNKRAIYTIFLIDPIVAQTDRIKSADEGNYGFINYVCGVGMVRSRSRLMSHLSRLFLHI